MRHTTPTTTRNPSASSAGAEAASACAWTAPIVASVALMRGPRSGCGVGDDVEDVGEQIADDHEDGRQQQDREDHRVVEALVAVRK